MRTITLQQLARQPLCVCSVRPIAARTRIQGKVGIAPGPIGSNGKTLSAVAAPTKQGVLLVQCPDAKGVVGSLAQLLYGYGCNILESDQYSNKNEDAPTFFQRIRFGEKNTSACLHAFYFRGLRLQQRPPRWVSC